jgi:hypothetical protein
LAAIHRGSGDTPAVPPSLAAIHHGSGDTPEALAGAPLPIFVPSVIHHLQAYCEFPQIQSSNDLQGATI